MQKRGLQGPSLKLLGGIHWAEVATPQIALEATEDFEIFGYVYPVTPFTPEYYWDGLFGAMATEINSSGRAPHYSEILDIGKNFGDGLDYYGPSCSPLCALVASPSCWPDRPVSLYKILHLDQIGLNSFKTSYSFSIQCRPFESDRKHYNTPSSRQW